MRAGFRRKTGTLTGIRDRFRRRSSPPEPAPRELLRRVRRIEITARRIVAELLAGEYRSVFKGRGMEFDEVREYQTGDEMRTIDWNVTARLGRPFVKRFVEERERRIFLLLDLSASGQFGSAGKSKNELAAELCAVLAFSAIENNDRVGLMIFTEEVEHFIPPEKGAAHVLYIIREILAFNPLRKGTCIATALDELGRMIKRDAVVFLVSDFLDAGYEQPLKRAAAHYDLIAVRVSDPREEVLPDAGLVRLQDPETGRMLTADTSSKAVREHFRRTVQQRRASQDALFTRLGMDHIDIQTHRDYVPDLIRFFKTRERRQPL
jgi:uncharacterized protein (DUF58 family)